MSVLVTPLHIVPEWYFLEFYMILKALPNKNAGFMISSELDNIVANIVEASEIVERQSMI